MPCYYNIHTHRPAPSTKDGLSIQSLYKDFGQVADGRYCSVGLHPWYLAGWEQAFVSLKQYATLPHVLAIGECGLDKVCDTDWETQTAAFATQIILANELQKPLIIHCVRAFDELIQLLDNYKVQVPVIIHGYNKNAAVASKLLDKGYYLSFGAALLTEKAPATEVLKSMPADRFFLETDDAALSIEPVYARAAEIRQCGEKEIILQVQQNFKNLFL